MKKSTDKSQGVKRETLGRWAAPLAWINCNPPKQKPHKSRTQGRFTRERTRGATRDDRYDPRNSEGNTYSEGSTTRTWRPESVHQGNGRGGYDAEYDQAEYLQAAPAPLAPQAPAPPSPGPVAQAAAAAAAATPAPAPPDHAQNDAAQTHAADVDAAHGDAAHAHGANAHAGQAGSPAVNNEQPTAGPNHEQDTG